MLKSGFVLSIRAHSLLCMDPFMAQSGYALTMVQWPVAHGHDASVRTGKLVIIANKFHEMDAQEKVE